MRTAPDPYVGRMTRRPIILSLSLSLGLALAPPALAQEGQAPVDPAPEAGQGMEEGLGLVERGTRMILRGLMAEVEPRLKEMGEDLESALAEMEPAMRELARKIGDIRNYHAPEMLPNGDIILRRKVPLDPDAADPDETGPIDL